jgi:hypothetical protein
MRSSPGGHRGLQLHMLLQDQCAVELSHTDGKSGRTRSTNISPSRTRPRPNATEPLSPATILRNRSVGRRRAAARPAFARRFQTAVIPIMAGSRPGQRPPRAGAGFPKQSIVGGPGLGPRRPGLLSRRLAIAIAVVAAKQRRRFPIVSYPSSHERKRPSLRNPAHAAALSYTTLVRLPFGCGHMWEAIEDLAAAPTAFQARQPLCRCKPIALRARPQTRSLATRPRSSAGRERDAICGPP